MSVASLSLGVPQSPSRLLSACLQTAGRRQQCSHHLLLSLWAAHSSPVCPVPGHCTALPLDFQLVHSCSLAHWLLRPRGLLWCVWGSGLCSSHLSDSGNHFSTSEERHMNSPEHIPPPSSTASTAITISRGSKRLIFFPLTQLFQTVQTDAVLSDCSD